MPGAEGWGAENSIASGSSSVSAAWEQFCFSLASAFTSWRQKNNPRLTLPETQIHGHVCNFGRELPGEDFSGESLEVDWRCDIPIGRRTGVYSWL